jgi:hypothetical protein
MRSLTFLVFVILTFCCWGVYGPTLHLGQAALGAGPKQLSSLRPFICVGVAYFLIAVVYPMFMLKTKGEPGNWSVGGFVWSFVAGAVGAVGALGIVLAFKFGGKPVYVMPLVFGLAPIVNTFVTMLMSGTFKQASFRFYLGILLVAIGAAGVMRFKPTKAKVETTKTEITQVVLQQADELENVTEPVDVDKSETEKVVADKVEAASEMLEVKQSPVKKDTQPWLIGVCIAVTALCWGSYGTVLHKGQAKMAGSRLRPFLCVGLAYFAIAVIVPLMLAGSFPEPGSWDSLSGIGWSLAAGAAGALGALGIIYAFNFGGKPVFVMPLVFGFAPVVNTMVETFSKGLIEHVTAYFLAALAMVILGAVMVLVFAPRGPKPKPAAE